MAGLALAWIWLKLGCLPTLVLTFLVTAAGLIVDAVGRKHLLPYQAVRGTWAMEAWGLVPGSLAALAVAAIIIANARYKPVDPTLSVETKELISALLTAFAALLGAGLVKAAESTDQTWMAPHVKKAFEQQFKNVHNIDASSTKLVVVEPGSELACWVFYDTCHGVNGWGFTSRHRRAKGIQQSLRSRPAKPSRPQE